MGYDSRYPNMFRLGDAPGLDAATRAEARRVAAAICNRVDGLKCSYNVKTGGLFFHYTVEPDSGPTEIPFVKGDSHFNYAPHEIDNVVRYVNMGRIGRKAKNKIIARNEQLEAWRVKDANEAHKAERRPSARNYATFLDQRRRGVTKKIVAL